MVISRQCRREGMLGTTVCRTSGFFRAADSLSMPWILDTHSSCVKGQVFRYITNRTQILHSGRAMAEVVACYWYEVWAMYTEANSTGKSPSWEANCSSLGQEPLPSPFMGTEGSLPFDIGRSVHHHTIQINQPTRCNSFTSLLLEVYVSLNMFRALPHPSSRAHNCINSLWFHFGTWW